MGVLFSELAEPNKARLDALEGTLMPKDGRTGKRQLRQGVCTGSRFGIAGGSSLLPKKAPYRPWR